jgi:hypothetical protein
MVGRQHMTRIYNEFLYSFFYSIDHKNLILGKDKYLYTLVYPDAYLCEPGDEKRDELFDDLSLLALLQQQIAEMGKRLFVIITPSKVSIYPEYLPDAFDRSMSMKNAGKYSQNYYEYFVSRVGETGLKYFDFHDDFIKLRNEGIDIFTKSGIHWSGPAVAAYFSEFINIINSNLEKKIGTIQTVKAEPVWGNAFTTDDDIEEILNLFPLYYDIPSKIRKFLPFYPYIVRRNQFYSCYMEVLSIPTDYRPSVFVCGGSFNWAWLDMVFGRWDWVTHGDDHIFNSVELSFYNRYIRYITKYPEDERIYDTTDDFYSVLDKDIIIIEFNEEAMKPGNNQFTFVKNLLDFIEKERS